jgi:hypothetical protein
MFSIFLKNKKYKNTNSRHVDDATIRLRRGIL